MKTLTTLLFTLILLNTVSFGQQSISNAIAFIEKLDKEQFSEAYEKLDSDFQSQVSLAELEKMWKAIEKQCGNFQSFSDTREQQVKTLNMVTLGGVFEKIVLDIRVSVDGDKIAGLFFIPRAQAYVTAPYDKKNYTEQALNLSSENCELSGLLTLPANKKGNLPVIIFVHGSGPSDKDETIGPNKIFKDLSAGLAEKGIASYRCDKRSLTCAQTLMGKQDLTPEDEVINDVLHAIELVKKRAGIDTSEIYIAGHSLGGMLAPEIAKLAHVKGIILLNAPARFLGETVSDQFDYLYALGKVDLETKNKTQAQLKFMQSNDFNETTPKEQLPLDLPYSYWNYLKNYSQTFISKTLSCRILVVNSGRDYQVPVKEFEIWKSELKTAENATLKLFPDLNHLLFKSPEISKPSDYDVPGNVSPEVIDYLSKWIKTK